MAVAPAVNFAAKVERLFELLDKQGIDALSAMYADDVQGVDEISRGWLRGRGAINSYFEQLREMGWPTSSARSEIRA